MSLSDKIDRWLDWALVAMTCTASGLLLAVSIAAIWNAIPLLVLTVLMSMFAIAAWRIADTKEQSR